MRTNSVNGDDGVGLLARRHRMVFGWSFAAIVSGAAVVGYFLNWPLLLGIAVAAVGIGAMGAQAIRQRGQPGLRGLMVAGIIIYGIGAAVVLAALARHFHWVDLLASH